MLEFRIAGLRRALSLFASAAATAARAFDLCHFADDSSEYHRLLSRSLAGSDFQSCEEAAVPGVAAGRFDSAAERQTAGTAAIDTSHSIIDYRLRSRPSRALE